jgi:hypothetical protein
MESSKVGYWLQIGANIGILAGLILVIFQMNQNSELLRVQLIKQDGDAYIANEMAIAGENYAEVWARVLNDPYEPELSDMRVLEASLWGLNVYKWSNTYRLSRMGLLADADWKREIDIAVDFAFGNPYARGWWDALTQDYPQNVPPEVIDYADAKIRAVPLNATRDWFDSIKMHTQKYRED